MGKTKQVCWVIAGATSSIAKCFARSVAEQGHDVILLARDMKKLKDQQADLQIRYQINAHCLSFDALDQEGYQNLVAQCQAVAGKPLCLLVAFGYMPIADSLACAFEETANTIQINYTAAATLTMAFLPVLKAQSGSHILVLGSVAGDRGRASNFVYGSAKAALAQFCEGLRAALHGTAVSVTLMRLGYIDTPLTYGKPGYALAASPERCASVCLKMAERTRAAAYFPWFWRWIMLAFKLMPRFIFNRLKV